MKIRNDMARIERMELALEVLRPEMARLAKLCKKVTEENNKLWRQTEKTMLENAAIHAELAALRPEPQKSLGWCPRKGCIELQHEDCNGLCWMHFCDDKREAKEGA